LTPLFNMTKDRVRTGDEKSLNLLPSPWKVLNSDSEKKSLKSPWIFQFEHFFYEILGKWLKYRRSYHLKLGKYIFWGFWYVYRWSRWVDSHFRTVPYRYAIVREIVAFANFTINLVTLRYSFFLCLLQLFCIWTGLSV